jgi:hypothetical protein
MFDDVPDETLRTELRELDAKVATLRGKKRRYREDAHETLDLSVKASRARVDTLLREGVYQLSRSVGQAIAIPGLADAIAMTDPAIIKRWHALIDVAPGTDSPGATFGPLTRAEYQAQHDALRGEIDTRTRELARRIEARRHETAVAALEATPGTALDAADRSARNGPEPGEPGYGAHVHSAATQEVVPHG